MIRACFASLALVLALLMIAQPTNSQTASTLTLSYDFPFNGTASALFNAPYKPVYQLGVLSLNYSITFTISLPKIGEDTFMATLASHLQDGTIKGLQYIDNTQNPSVLVRANSITYPTPTSKNPYFFTYVISFPSSSTLTSASFIFDLTYATVDKLYFYTLQARYFPSTVLQTTVSAIKSATLLKVTDFFRSDILKLIYVSQPNSVFSFSSTPASIVCRSPTADQVTQARNDAGKLFANSSASVTLIQTAALDYKNAVSTPTSSSTQSQLLGLNVAKNSAQSDFSASGAIFYLLNYVKTAINSVGSVLTTASTISDCLKAANAQSGVGYFTQTFSTSGFYLIQFQPSSETFVEAKTTFDTDLYACPYSPNFTDFFMSFQSCNRSSSSTGLPCLSFDTVTQTCSQCLQGYDLADGFCFTSTTCPARQYFSFGVCLNVSQLCDSFDAFTGTCLNCSDPVNYDFNNDTCVHKTVTCGVSQYQVNYNCYNVSATCSTFDPNTGKCLTCLSDLYQLNSDGSCTLIVVNCPQGQHVIGLNCVTIPVECLNFDNTLSQCLSCINGYFNQGGVCKRIACPGGQVPSGKGSLCRNVSPLCDAYDFTSGDCLSCKQKGYTIREGRCEQIGNSLAGCAEREALGFGPCVSTNLNCRIFNLISKNRQECNTAYYMDFTGHCSLSSSCGPRQWSVNGECLAYPDNCLKVDRIGLCTQCANDNYRLQQGQCVFFKSCLSQQFLNSAGQCVDVDAGCDTFNPTNGNCLTCKDAGTQPVSGVCCPAGQVYSSGSCVDSMVLQNTYLIGAAGPSCLIRHPSLSFCLQCAEDYSPDYIVPYACAPN